MVSGLFIGVFLVVVIVGVFDFVSVLWLVVLCGDLMEQVYFEGYGLMVIMGLICLWVEVLMQGYEVYFVNLNVEMQFVIVGCDEVMVEVVQLVLWVGVSKVQWLVVSVLLYCVLLDKFVVELVKVFVGVSLRCLWCVYLSGLMVCVLWDLQWIVDDLVMNMVCLVYWQEVMVVVDECDVCLVIEMFFGGVFICLICQVGWCGEIIVLECSGLDVVCYLVQWFSD